jgi:ABC-type glycerol-3-phosphate transport system substrate-binding protein
VKKLSVLLVVLMLATMLTACAAPAPQVVEKVVTQEVEKVVTQVVEKEVKVVETQVVEKVVEKVVEATPVPAQPSGCNVDSPANATQVDMIGWAFPITTFYAKELEKCNGVDNIRVNTQLLDSGSAKEQARLALSGQGTSPYEIVHVDDAMLTEFAAQGKIQPLDEFIAKYKDQYDLGDISDALYKLGTYDGKIYGVPIVANTMHYFYNTETFEKLGLQVPDTWDDVIASCGKLKEADDAELPFTFNLHAGWAWRVEFHSMLKAFGGDWLNEDNTPKFNGPEGVQAVEKMLEVVEACMGEDGLTWSIDDSEIGLETGTLPSAHTWASRAANMDNPEKSQFVGKIGFAPAPRAVAGGPHGGPAAADFYAIPTKTDVDPELIFRIIMEAADLESQMEAAKLGLVTRDAVAEAGAGGRYLQASLETIANGASNYGPNPAGALARTAIENTLPKVATGEMTAQEALDAAAELYITEATKQGYIK